MAPHISHQALIIWTGYGPISTPDACSLILFVLPRLFYGYRTLVFPHNLILLNQLSRAYWVLGNYFIIHALSQV
ncbi:transmembrane protein, putative [Medicago truncatula]|uniref:Transmembrane protein, putative n=1 Tax=Medicago truncatula TaxID=3880 RepID=G7IH47_MEDTR|nr:transmembrane protein, putative [Medicago truncatula]